MKWLDAVKQLCVYVILALAGFLVLGAILAACVTKKTYPVAMTQEVVWPFGWLWDLRPATQEELGGPWQGPPYVPPLGQSAPFPWRWIAAALGAVVALCIWSEKLRRLVTWPVRAVTRRK